MKAIKFYNLLPTENDEHIVFSEWLKLKNIPFYHIPNEGKRHFYNAKRMIKMGLSKGVPDICIPIPNAFHHALYIEMKRKSGGIISCYQQKWINTLVDLGNFAVVAKGASQAIAITEKYLTTARLQQ